MLASFATTVALLVGLAADPAANPVRLVRSTSGPRGAAQGSHYVVEDPRTTFVAGADRQVVVFFEWEAPPGHHHCEATWRDPSGRAVLISPADYDAKVGRFGAYWSLGLPDSPALGLWAVETTVDGQPAGTHAFRISQGETGAGPHPPAVLAPKDIYARIMASTVALEAVGAQGEKLWTGSGFYLDETHVATAFQVIEGASSVRAVLPSGQTVDASDIAVANRRQDWAILSAAPSGARPLGARKVAVSVGDRGTFLDVGSDGSRTLQEASILGQRDTPGAGPRLNLSSAPSGPAVGSPLVDEHGDVIGILGGALVPGATMLQAEFRVVSSFGFAPAAMAVPVGALPDLASIKGETFKVADLLARGVVAPPVTRSRSVSYGVVGRGEATARSGISGVGQLSHRDGTASVQITWDSSQKQAGEAAFLVFDIDNHVVTGSKPSKISVRVGEMLVTTWKLPLGGLTQGVYRIDLLLDGGVAWRTFLTLAD